MIMEMAFFMVLAAFFATAKYTLDMGARKQKEIDKLKRQKQALIFNLLKMVDIGQRPEDFNETQKRLEADNVARALEAIWAEG